MSGGFRQYRYKGKESDGHAEQIATNFALLHSFQIISSAEAMVWLKRFSFLLEEREKERQRESCNFLVTVDTVRSNGQD